MEVIVRTAHGAADVALDLGGRDVSLREVIAAVTGQAVPRAARVDGRIVDSGDSIRSCGVLAGSTIDTLLDDADQSVDSGVVELVQLSGPGAGRRVCLDVGRYLIGPGRRTNASQLSTDSTQVVAIELDVSAMGCSVSTPADAAMLGPVELGSAVLIADTPTPWRDQVLKVGGRLFALEPITPTSADGTPASGLRSDAAVDGFIAHNRPPGVIELDHTIADTFAMARERSPNLWHRRTDGFPISVDIGLTVSPPDYGATDELSVTPVPFDPGASNGVEPLAVQLDTGHPTVIVGRADERAALCRALLIDVATRYGPADVDLVIATTPEELPEWDWVKWLPHAKPGLSVALLTNDLGMAAFAERDFVRATVIVLTADRLWNSPTSPLRSTLFDAPVNTAAIVLTDEVATSPSNTFALIDLDRELPGSAQLDYLGNDHPVENFFAPLIERDTAAEIARSLTPLIDPDRSGPARPTSHAIGLEALVPVDEAESLWESRLGQPGQQVVMPLGTLADTVVGVDLGPNRGVIVSGSTVDEALGIASVLTLSIAATWSPREATLLVIDHRDSPAEDAIAELPHTSGTFTSRERHESERLVASIRGLVNSPASATARWIILIASTGDTQVATPGLVGQLAELASESVGVHIVAATDQPIATIDAPLLEACPIAVAVDRYGGIRRATLHDPSRHLRTPFDPFDERADDPDSIRVRPVVFGRRPTALERRLLRGSHSTFDRRDRPADRIARHLMRLAETSEQPRPPQVIPEPLTTRSSAYELWANHPGDGVPLGTTIHADATNLGAFSWLPGENGTGIVLGGPRSGISGLFDVLVIGIAERYAPGAVEIYAVDHNERRCRALRRLEHVAESASPEHAGATESMLEAVAQTMHERSHQLGFDPQENPGIVVTVRDLDRLTAQARAALKHLLVDGTAVGINVVAAATRPDAADELVALAQHLAVGALNESDAYASLGIDADTAASIELVRGRVLAGGDLVQLAELDVSLDEAVDAVGSSRATTVSTDGGNGQ